MKATEAGFTLVEVVVALTVFVMVLGVALALYTQGTVMYKRQEMGVEVQENARIALDRMVRELRTAKQVISLTESSITFTLSDGSQVRYYHDVSRQQLMREKNGGANPVASFVKNVHFEREPPGASKGVLISITIVAGAQEEEGYTYKTRVFVR